jgi:hypothetical protein
VLVSLALEGGRRAGGPSASWCAIIDGKLQSMNVNLRSPRKSFLVVPGCDTLSRKSVVTAGQVPRIQLE